MKLLKETPAPSPNETETIVLDETGGQSDGNPPIMMDPDQIPPSIFADPGMQMPVEGKELQMEPDPFWTMFDNKFLPTKDEELLQISKEEVTRKMHDILQTLIKKDDPRAEPKMNVTAPELLKWREDIVNDYNAIAGLKDNQVYDFRSNYKRDKTAQQLNKGTARTESQMGRQKIRSESKDAIESQRELNNSAMEEDLKKNESDVMSDVAIPDNEKKTVINRNAKIIKSIYKDAMKLFVKAQKATDKSEIGKLNDIKNSQIRTANTALKGLRKNPHDDTRVGVTDRTAYDKEKQQRKEIVENSGFFFRLFYSDWILQTREFSENEKVVDPKEFNLAAPQKFALEKIEIENVLPLIAPRADDSIIDMGTGPYSQFDKIEDKMKLKQAEINNVETDKKVLDEAKKEIEKDEKKDDVKTDATYKKNIEDGIKTDEERKTKLEEELKEFEKQYGEKMVAFEQIKKGEKTPDDNLGEPTQKQLADAEEEWKQQQEKLRGNELKQKYMKLYGLKEDDPLLKELIENSEKTINPQKWMNSVVKPGPEQEELKDAGSVKKGMQDKSEIKNDSMTISSVIKYGVYNTTPEKRYSKYSEQEEYQAKPTGTIDEEFNWLIKYKVVVKKD